MFRACNFFLLLAFAIFVSGRFSFDDVLDKEWHLFKLQHSKVYQNLFEERYRKYVYAQNKLQIIEHNELYELGHVSYKLGLNEFSDLHHREFVAQMNCGFNSSSDTNSEETRSQAATFMEPDFDVPNSVDWRQKGAVTQVKYQGQCGSCWAFGTCGVLEGQYFRKTGRLISLSAQNLVDCSGTYGNHGCQGGNSMRAYKYIKGNGGIDTDASYPYETQQGNCRYNAGGRSGVTVLGYVYTPAGNEKALKKAVATIGPIEVAIDASSNKFKQYREGVYYDQSCSSTRVNHEVLIVGYGTTANGKDYWIMKNSWGTSWGSNGYMLMARNRKNNCGVATWANYPLV